MAYAERMNSGVIELRLSEEEAHTIRDILGNIGGDPEKSRRRYTKAISVALDNVGVFGKDQSDMNISYDGGIYFNSVLPKKPSFNVGDVVEIVDSEGRTNEALQVGEVGIVTLVKDIPFIRVNPFKGGDEATDYGFFPDSLKLLRKAKG